MKKILSIILVAVLALACASKNGDENRKHYSGYSANYGVWNIRARYCTCKADGGNGGVFVQHRNDRWTAFGCNCKKNGNIKMSC